MANCKYCGKNMLEADSCEPIPIKHDGKEYAPLKFGEDGKADWANSNGRCPDCGTKLGGYHHPECDVEVDPIRYGLLFERFLNPDRISIPDCIND